MRAWPSPRPPPTRSVGGGALDDCIPSPPALSREGAGEGALPPVDRSPWRRALGAWVSACRGTSDLLRRALGTNEHARGDSLRDLHGTNEHARGDSLRDLHGTNEHARGDALRNLHGTNEHARGDSAAALPLPRPRGRGRGVRVCSRRGHPLPRSAWEGGGGRALVALALAGCGHRIADPSAADRAGGVAFVRVTAEGDRGARERPLPFTDTGAPFTVRLEVFDGDHQPLTSFDGWLSLSITPGVLTVASGANVVGNLVRLTHGRVEGLRIDVARSYGEARLWAEDAGYVPVDPRRSPPPACADGLDDDGDGRVDYPADTGCEAVNDDDERAGSFAAGVSEPMYFSTPLVADVQGRSAQSPLLDERVTLEGRAEITAPPEGDRVHRLVVTQTDNSGFYVTDIDDRSCGGEHCFNSVYSFNFRTPDGMRPCDLLSTLTGSVAEFVNTTQLAQPGFQVGVEWSPDSPATGACLIPPADVITPATARDAALLERYESGLVRVEGVTLPTLIGPAVPEQGRIVEGATNCDLNGDGRITYGGNAEGNCANDCLADPTCSEWSSWARYGQLTVTLPTAPGEPVARVAITPKSVSPSFDPLRPRGPTATVTGTLRQVGPNWVINPRCEQDLVIAGDGQTVRNPNETCLHERSIGEE